MMKLKAVYQESIFNSNYLTNWLREYGKCEGCLTTEQEKELMLVLKNHLTGLAKARKKLLNMVDGTNATHH